MAEINEKSGRQSDSLPGQWTLVKETNMEKREPMKKWRKATSKTTENLSRQLKESLLQHPHPELSEQALLDLDLMRQALGR